MGTRQYRYASCRLRSGVQSIGCSFRTQKLWSALETQLQHYQPVDDRHKRILMKWLSRNAKRGVWNRNFVQSSKFPRDLTAVAIVTAALHENRLIPRFDTELQSTITKYRPHRVRPSDFTLEVKIIVRWLCNFLTARTHLRTLLCRLPHNIRNT